MRRSTMTSASQSLSLAMDPAALIEYFYPTKNMGHELARIPEDQKRLLREERLRVTLKGRAQ